MKGPITGQTEDTPSLPARPGEEIKLSAALVWLLVATIGLIVHQASYWPWTSDDAYITFRYSENLANGLGAVFNPGERVEGYTNFLWMVILAAFHGIGAHTVLTAKILGATCGVVALLLSAILTHHLSGGRWTLAAIVAPLMLASSPFFAAWSVAGLETAPFTILMTVAVLRYAMERERTDLWPWSGALLALAGMTRPEGVLIFILLLGLSAVRMAGGPGSWDRARVRRELSWVAMFLVLAAPYMIWRWAYYGHLFPNTFYVKTGRGVVQLLGGILYVTAGIRKNGGVLFNILALTPASWGPCRSRATPFVVVLVGWQAYNVYKGHDVLELFRFFVPILPILYAMGCVAVAQLYEIARPRFRRPWVPGALVALFAGVTVVVNLVMSYMSHDQRPQLREYQLQIRIGDAEFRQYAKRLMAIVPGGASIALIDAGVMPYMTKWYTIDRFGLCDAHIARTKPRGRLGEKFDEAYVLSRKPTFIQTKVTADMEERNEIHRGWAGDAELFASPRFRREYVRVEDAVLDGFFVRKDELARLSLAGEP